MSWLFGTTANTQFDELVEKATSELLPSGSEDIALNLEVCDQIRSKSVAAKDAVRSLKTRVNHKNPNVQILALILTDACIKNGGDLFCSEITGREFVDNLVSILKQPVLNHEVKEKILFYIQNWAIALEGKPTMGHLPTVYKTLQKEGFNFPPRDLSATNAAMTETLTAPEWIDSDVCLRCRTPFTFTNRKHHCRNCGQVFDHQCSSKTRPLPHFGITQAVRVCDGCFTVLDKGGLAKSSSAGSGRSSRHRSGRTRSVDFADADLQRALELSLQENRKYMSNMAPSEPPLIDRTQRNNAYREEDDPELKAAIEASLREASAPRASAPPTLPEDEQQSYQPAYMQHPYQSTYVPPERPAFTLPNYDLEPLEADAVLSFNQTVEDAQAKGGLTVSRGHNVNELFERASRVRPKLAMSLDDADRKQQILLDMNTKITEATRMYDQLLTQQISTPSWKRQLSHSQPQQASAATAHNTWHPAPVVEPSTSSPTPHHHPTPVFTSETPAQQYNQAQPWHAATNSLQQNVQSPIQMAPITSHQWNQLQTTYTPSPAQPVSIVPQQPIASQANIPPTTMYAPHSVIAMSPPPIPQTSPQPMQLNPQPSVSYIPPAPSQPVLTIPAQHSAPALPTVAGSYHPTAPLTFNQTPAVQPPQAMGSQQVHQGVNATVPIFPQVPTSDPHRVFPSYVPPVTEPPERKEALLIEL